MAKSITIESGSILIGNPICVGVVSENVGSKATFHRVKLTVEAILSSELEGEIFELSATAGDSETIVFDVSDALRTAARKYRFAPVTAKTTFPFIKYKLSAHDEYMIDGILKEKVGVREYASTLNALMGAFTDIERYLSGNTKTLNAFSRKPEDGEVCSSDETVVYPIGGNYGYTVSSTLTEGPSVGVVSLRGKSGMQQIGGRNVYVDPNAENRIQFQFVNGLGVIESVSAETLETLSTEGSNENYSITAPSGFGSVNRLFVRKSGRRPTFKCSTGNISKEWAVWWHDEFLGSDNFRRMLPESCWVKISGHWIPCAVYTEEDLTIFDRTKSDMIHIDFTVALSIDGMPFI